MTVSSLHMSLDLAIFWKRFEGTCVTADMQTGRGSEKPPGREALSPFHTSCLAGGPAAQ